MATEQDVLSVLRYAAAAWPRTEMTPETVAVYVMHLLRSRLAADVLLLAAMRLAERSEFLPSVASLLAEARQIAAQREAWAITANCRLYGHDLPEELMLPAALVRSWLEPEELVLPAALIRSWLGYESVLELEAGER